MSVKTSTFSAVIGWTGSGSGFAWPTPAGSKVYTNASAPGEATPLVLTAGFNSIPVLPGAQWVVLVPTNDPTSPNVNPKTLKGLTGDTGIPLNPALPIFIPVASGTTAVGITVVAQETVDMMQF